MEEDILVNSSNKKVLTQLYIDRKAVIIWRVDVVMTARSVT